MKRVDTIVMTVLVLLTLGVLLHQTRVRDHSAQNESPAHVQHGQTVFVQTDGFTAGTGGHGWTIATRKYKPRSTQPVRLTEGYIPGPITIVDPNDARRGGKRVVRTIAVSRTILLPLTAVTLRSTTERTSFTHIHQTEVLLTA